MDVTFVVVMIRASIFLINKKKQSQNFIEKHISLLEKNNKLTLQF